MLSFCHATRRDGDFGSDIDSDGEGVAAALIRTKWEGEETAGPRFIKKISSSTITYRSFKFDGSGNVVSCSDKVG